MFVVPPAEESRIVLLETATDCIERASEIGESERVARRLVASRARLALRLVPCPKLGFEAAYLQAQCHELE